MKHQFELLRTCRKNIIEVVDNLSLEQIQIIPKGFKNSIFWNMAHCLVTQQLLTYNLADKEIKLPPDWIENYKKGSVPVFEIGQVEVDYIKQKLIETVNQLEIDYNNNLFDEFKEYPTSFNFMLKNIEDAIMYNILHEGLHYGYILALQKLV